MAVIYMQEMRSVQDLLAPAPLLHLGPAAPPKEIYTRCIIYLSSPQGTLDRAAEIYFMIYSFLAGKADYTQM
jgi:hypothetical protein